MEATIVGKIQRAFKARGFFLVKIHGSEMQQAGLPDLIGCCNGRFIGLEVKDPGHARRDLCARSECATPLQLYTLEEIRSAGGIGVVVHSLAEAEKVLDEACVPLPPG